VLHRRDAVIVAASAAARAAPATHPYSTGSVVCASISRVTAVDAGWCGQENVRGRLMKMDDAAEIDRAKIMRASAELLAAVNAADADRCAAMWATDGVLMPPHHPSVHGHHAIVEYFRKIFARAKFRFTFTSSQIHFAADTAIEHVTYTAIIWGDDIASTEDAGKGLHVYRRQPDGSWKLACDIWNSDRAIAP
jgi:uncharacterized protein (TIGR02246 family)